MLKTIKQAIDDLPEQTFSEFYQSYVSDVQDQIIQHDIGLASTCYKSLEDTRDLIKGINEIAEELKKI